MGTAGGKEEPSSGSGSSHLSRHHQKGLGGSSVHPRISGQTPDTRREHLGRSCWGCYSQDVPVPAQLHSWGLGFPDLMFKKLSPVPPQNLAPAAAVVAELGECPAPAPRAGNPQTPTSAPIPMGWRDGSSAGNAGTESSQGSETEMDAVLDLRPWRRGLKV